jgi:hypothetical protein
MTIPPIINIIQSSSLTSPVISVSLSGSVNAAASPLLTSQSIPTVVVTLHDSLTTATNFANSATSASIAQLAYAGSGSFTGSFQGALVGSASGNFSGTANATGSLLGSHSGSFAGTANATGSLLGAVSGTFVGSVTAIGSLVGTFNGTSNATGSLIGALSGSHTGSLSATGSLSGSVIGSVLAHSLSASLVTPSNLLASQAVSSSYAVSASYAGGNFVPLSGSSAVTGSLTLSSGSLQLNQNITLGYSGSVRRVLTIWSDASNNNDPNYGYSTIEVRQQDGFPIGAADNRGNEMVFTNRSYLSSNSSGFKFIYSGSNLGGHNLFELIGNGVSRFSINNIGDITFTGQINSDIYAGRSNTTLQFISSYGNSAGGPATSFINLANHGIAFTWIEQGVTLMTLRGVDTSVTTRSGFLGLGIDPTVKLHVAGDGNITGSLVVGDSVKTGSFHIYSGNNQNFFSGNAGQAALLVESYTTEPATAGNTLKNSPQIVLRGSYWNGGPTTLDVGTVQGLATSTAGFGKLVLSSQGNGWSIQGQTGNFYAENDNACDIGASAGNRPKTIYAGTSLIVADNGGEIVSRNYRNYGAGAWLINSSLAFKRESDNTGLISIDASNVLINALTHVSVSNGSNIIITGIARAGDPTGANRFHELFGGTRFIHGTAGVSRATVIVQAIPSQSQNLQEWQLPDGTSVAKMDISGGLWLSNNISMSIDNTWDIGASSVGRPRNIYAGTNINATNAVIEGILPRIGGIWSISRFGGGATPFNIDVTNAVHQGLNVGPSVSGSSAWAGNGFQVIGTLISDTISALSALVAGRDQTTSGWTSVPIRPGQPTGNANNSPGVDLILQGGQGTGTGAGGKIAFQIKSTDGSGLQVLTPLSTYMELASGSLTVSGSIRHLGTKTPTSTSDTSGQIGDHVWDDNFIYVKTSAGWKRSALSTF